MARVTKPDVVKTPVPIMLAITTTVAEKNPICLAMPGLLVMSALIRVVSAPSTWGLPLRLTEDQKILLRQKVVLLHEGVTRTAHLCLYLVGVLRALFGGPSTESMRKSMMAMRPPGLSESWSLRRY